MNGFVLLKLEAARRGFRNVLAFRRWCRRHAVAIRKDGRMEWVCPGDVDQAVAPMPVSASNDATIAAGVAMVKAGVR